MQKEVDGKPHAVIELKCVYEEGPGWKELAAVQQKNPSEILWSGCRIEAVIREYRGQMRPVIVFSRGIDTSVTSVSVP